jgi:hypothetical protein
MQEPANRIALQKELADRVCQRTGRRVQNLSIELRPDGVVLYGRAPTYHVKQLAQQGVRDLLPQVELLNAIVVG